MPKTIVDAAACYDAFCMGDTWEQIAAEHKSTVGTVVGRCERYARHNGRAWPPVRDIVHVPLPASVPRGLRLYVQHTHGMPWPIIARLENLDTRAARTCAELYATNCRLPWPARGGRTPLPADFDFRVGGYAFTTGHLPEGVEPDRLVACPDVETGWRRALALNDAQALSWEDTRHALTSIAVYLFTHGVKP